jgi:tetraacyldisaccharide 4'-kinase
MGVLRVRRAAVPVVSIGNLTAGGTGKTPLTIALAERLVARGEKVFVLARGYGASRAGELNDELELVRSRVPGVSVLAGGDRAALADVAVREGATVLLLDDGFQHRRLARDVDVVVIDATDPWGEGFLLPRGLLREPVSAARRASAVVISRVEQASPGRVAEIRERLEREGVSAPLAAMRFESVGLRPLGKGQPLSLEELRGKRVTLVSGIGNPEAFRATVAGAGARVEAARVFPDHHAFTRGDLESVARASSTDLLLVTEKDAVKLGPLLEGEPLFRPVYSLSISARLENEGALFSQIEAALERNPHPNPPPLGGGGDQLASPARASREAPSGAVP